MKLKQAILLLSILFTNAVYSQNSMVGDGFGGRLWYNPSNYTVGSYSGYSICHDICGGGEAQLYCWGSNFYNQLGLGLTVPGVNVPTIIPNTNGVKYFSTGYIMGAIKTDNSGWAWGGGITGLPIEVINDVKFLDASSTTISFIKNDGSIWSIGNNGSGNFGDGTTTSSTTIPIKMQLINNAVRVTNNGSSTTVLLSDGTLMFVGNIAYGGQGVLDLDLNLSPLVIPGLSQVVDIKSNASHTFALTANGDVYYWGYDAYTAVFTLSPTLFTGLSNIVAISACDDGYHFMALDENKNCYVWGDNSFGQCGISATTSPSVSTPILVNTDVIDIMAGETFSYLIKSDGTLWGAGMSLGYSIWLNLPDIQREVFTQLDPSALPGSCELIGINANTTSCVENTPGTITVTNYGGDAPYTYSIGGAFQSSNVFSSVSAGTYTVTVQDNNGCEYSTSVTVDGQNCLLPPAIFLPEGFIDFPNVFSPNQDEENQHFYFPNEGLTGINCKIFDRWGVLVYEWNETDGYWDGKTSDGRTCTEGTYYYTVSYSIFETSRKTNRGFITLIR